MPHERGECLCPWPRPPPLPAPVPWQNVGPWRKRYFCVCYLKNWHTLFEQYIFLNKIGTVWPRAALSLPWGCCGHIAWPQVGRVPEGLLCCLVAYQMAYVKMLAPSCLNLKSFRNEWDLTEAPPLNQQLAGQVPYSLSNQEAQVK